MASMLYFLSCLCFSSSAFLLDTNTPAQVGGLMTDNHYDYLLKLFMDERNARLQLQQYVVNQQQQITILPGLQSRVETIENAYISQGQTNVTAGIYRKYEELEKKYEAIQNNQMKLNDELNLSKNRTRDLEKEVEILKQIKTINQLQTLSTLQQNVQSIQANLNSLISNSQARGQDIVSIHSDMMENKHKIQSLEHTIVKNISNLEFSMNQKETVLENNYTSLFMKFSSFKTSQIMKSNNLSLATEGLMKTQKSIRTQMQNLTHEVNEDRKLVGFTANGVSNRIMSSGTTLKFPNILFSYGLLNLSTFKNTGIFTCERDGLYLLIVSVTAGSTSDAGFSIYKNSRKTTGQIYIGQSSTSTREFNSGTGSLLLELKVSDTVYIKTVHSDMNVYETLSSFTVIKIK